MEQETEWNREFHGIGIKLEPAIARVNNDTALKAYMGFRLSKAILIAQYIITLYRSIYDQPLQITSMSLGVEIMAHFVVQEIFLKIKKVITLIKFLPGKEKSLHFCDRMLLHMEVIDCGEKHCDNNRFVWDLLAGPISLVKNTKRNLQAQHFE